jgi:hypothetical protein
MASDLAQRRRAARLVRRPKPLTYRVHALRGDPVATLGALRDLGFDLNGLAAPLHGARRGGEPTAQTWIAPGDC